MYTTLLQLANAFNCIRNREGRNRDAKTCPSPYIQSYYVTTEHTIDV